MIPKKIHYCWFGGNPLPQKAQKCISSWRKYCPDYEIIEWNESNFDFAQHPYLQWCYDNKKWAFLSDFARLLIILQQGGIYFDTDVELLKKPDELLKYHAFYGFETNDYVATGLGFGAEKGDQTVLAMAQMYDHLTIDENGDYQLIGCPRLNTAAMDQYGLVHNGARQNIAGAEIFPIDYFNPYEDATGRLNKTANTISVHWYSKTWMDKKAVFRSNLLKPVHRIFGEDCFGFLKRNK